MQLAEKLTLHVPHRICICGEQSNGRRDQITTEPLRLPFSSPYFFSNLEAMQTSTAPHHRHQYFCYIIIFAPLFSYGGHFVFPFFFLERLFSNALLSSLIPLPIRKCPASSSNSSDLAGALLSMMELPENDLIDFQLNSPPYCASQDLSFFMLECPTTAADTADQARPDETT